MIIAGYLLVDPRRRESYLADCVGVVEQARRTPGCLEFAITADVVEPDRVVVLERWETREAVEAFRGSGPSGPQREAVLGAVVAEYDVAGSRALT